MLHIVLLILKIIGIVLAVLLGILLLGLCLALFVPLRYQLEARRTEGEDEPPIEIRAKFTWLLHFINVRIQYPSEVYVRARVFLVTVFRLPRRQKQAAASGQESPSEREGRKRQEKTKKQSGESEKADVTEEGQSQKQPDKKEPDKNQPSGKDTGSVNRETETGPSAGKEAREKRRSRKSVKGFFRFLKKKILKICGIFQNIQYTIKRICDKIRAIWENIDYYLNILKEEAFKNSFALCKEELFSVFSYVKPRKLKADLTIGTGDPASTAKIFAYYGMLYPAVGNHVAVTPDFDEKRIEGTVFIKGKVMLFTFLKAAIRIYFNKDIRKLFKLFKKEDA